MNFDERFLSNWNRIQDLEIPEEPEDTICIYALKFQDWTSGLLKVLKNPDPISINQTKILLSDKYFEWKRFVPQSHRQRLGIHGHTCIYQIYENAYEKLQIVELSLTPPKIYIPVIPPPQPKPPNIAGLFIGEGSDLDDE